MNVVGIICEYNPLHNGHVHHMRMAKEQSGADALICVMSGAFVQRGEPALFDAFTRARWAVQAGADAVILLPAIYSLASADDFAHGGMMALRSTGIVSGFSFGCTYADPQTLLAAAKWLLEPSDAVSNALKAAVSNGMGYPAALCLAARTAPPEGVSGEVLSDILQSANDTLGVRYLLENETGLPALGVFPVRREERFAHASDLRQALLHRAYSNGPKHRKSDAANEVWLGAPEFAAREMLQKKPCRSDFYNAMLAAHLRLCSREALQSVCCMTPNLCENLLGAARQSADAAEIVDLVSGRHRTRARVRRALWHSMLGIDSALYEEAKKRLPYLRVLAVKKGRENLLGLLEARAAAPVLTSGKTQRLSPFAQECAALDARAMDLQAMCLDDVSCGAWFTKKLEKA